MAVVVCCWALGDARSAMASAAARVAAVAASAARLSRAAASLEFFEPGFECVSPRALGMAVDLKSGGTPCTAANQAFSTAFSQSHAGQFQSCDWAVGAGNSPLPIQRRVPPLSGNLPSTPRTCKRGNFYQFGSGFAPQLLPPLTHFGEKREISPPKQISHIPHRRRHERRKNQQLAKPIASIAVVTI